MTLKKITKNRKPLVSVIIPVYNAGDFLLDALNSLFNQNYNNIEVIAINDASTDNSLKILTNCAQKEPRLKIYQNQKNLGVARTANIGISQAKGQFIARMDADDLIPSDRIKKQVTFLLDHPETVVVGGQVELISKQGKELVTKQFPLTHKKIINMAFTAMPIQQGAMMVNKNLLPENFVWYRYFDTSEDLDFFLRVFKYGKGANLPQIVLYYRQHGESLTQVGDPKNIFFHAYKIRQKAMSEYKNEVGFYTVLISKLQYLLVLLLPSKIIYPLYYFWRGLKPSLPSKKIFNFVSHAVSYLF